ncbi:MAG: hypothetical protein K2X10_10320 [Hyphomicrobiales bacterium]|nr:hypothetical protein [Hyphomicrobiales bacterium]
MSGCSRDERPLIHTNLAGPALPEAARLPCAPPTNVGSTALSERAVLHFWARDRSALRECEVRRRAAVSAVDALNR